MNENYTIVYVEKPGQDEWSAIGQGISDYNQQQAGDEQAQRICFVVKAEDDTIVGGIICAIYWNWLYVDLLWLEEKMRGQGYGHQLMVKAEDEARKRGAKKAYLDTFSFQAPDFYKQHGYQVFGELSDFPAGHQRYFLTKEL